MANTAKQIKQWLELARAQMAAETYLNRALISGITGGDLPIENALAYGVNNPDYYKDILGKSPTEKRFSSATRFTASMASDFTNNWDIVDHQVNTATGFSATVFLGKTGEYKDKYVVSFRSTEFQKEATGGDFTRDAFDGADGEIFASGFSYAQLDDMEAWYQKLTNPARPEDRKIPTGTQLTVTGYSLGGHLAMAFTLLHTPEVESTVTFNGAGLGSILGAEPTGTRLAAALALYRKAIENPIVALKDVDEGFFTENPGFGTAGNPVIKGEAWASLPAGTTLSTDGLSTERKLMGSGLASCLTHPPMQSSRHVSPSQTRISRCRLPCDLAWRPARSHLRG